MVITQRVIISGCIIVLLTFNPVICLVSQASDVPKDIYAEIVKSHNHIFIGTATNKTIESDRTYYVFNVTEYLKHPLNAPEITLTAYGGYEIGVSPSTSFTVGQAYFVFFNELDEDNKIVGFDYYSKFLGSLDDSDILSIREVVNQVSATELAVSAFNKQLDNAYNINVTKMMKYQMEYPDGSGNISDVWRIDIRGEGLDENGYLVWRAIVFQVILETGELVIGPVTGGEIVDVADSSINNHETISYLPIVFFLVLLMFVIIFRIIGSKK